eukprot:6089566-Amphidinium_carterae.2
MMHTNFYLIPFRTQQTCLNLTSGPLACQVRARPAAAAQRPEAPAEESTAEDLHCHSYSLQIQLRQKLLQALFQFFRIN